MCDGIRVQRKQIQGRGLSAGLSQGGQVLGLVRAVSCRIWRDQDFGGLRGPEELGGVGMGAQAGISQEGKMGRDGKN